MAMSSPVVSALRCILVVAAQFVGHVLDSGAPVPLQKSLCRVQQKMPVSSIHHKPLVLDRFALFQAVHEPERFLIVCDSRPHSPPRLSNVQDASNAVHNLDAVRIALGGSLLNEEMASLVLFLRCRLHYLQTQYARAVR